MEYIKLSAEGNVGVLTINRPAALNALSDQVSRELDEALDSIDLDSIRCLVVTGEGQKAFVAGADIGQMSGLSKAEGEAFGKLGNDVFRKLETLPIPTIAAVCGFALGGGCELAMSCDIRLCSDTAVFGQPEVGLGITPGFGGTQRMARLIGMGRAKELLYTARKVKAPEALAIGLVQGGPQHGTAHRGQRPHRRARLQKGGKRWPPGGYGPCRHGGRKAVRLLLRDRGPEKRHERLCGKAQARPLRQSLKFRASYHFLSNL